MNSRERVITAMNRNVPDRVPFDIAGFAGRAWDTFRTRSKSEDPFEYFNTDVRHVWMRGPDDLPDYSKYYKDEKFPAGTGFDPHGVAQVPGSFEHFTHIVSPLRNATDIKELIEYPLPDYTRPECYAHVIPNIEEYHKRGLAVTGGMECTLFEHAWQIRGMEPFLTDLYTQPEWAEVLVDKWLKVRLFIITKYAEAGADIIRMGDDVGMQTGMMMSPEIWRKIFKPRMAKLISTAKSIKKDILIFYHSDGNIEKIIPELIEIGVNILNPVQPECLDPEKIAFWGTIGTQSTMPFGSVEDVRNIVKERIRTCGKSGGLLLAPTHVLEPEVPWENIVAFVEAVKEFGKY